MLDPLLSALTFLFINRTTITTQYENNILSATDGKTTQNIQKPIKKETQNVWRGKISTYSAHYGSCLGCSPHYSEKGELYYVRADGTRLIDDAGIAFNHLSLGTRISICNISDFAQPHCTGGWVADTGGFEKYNRIADLSPSVAINIGAKTDQSIVEITAL